MNDEIKSPTAQSPEKKDFVKIYTEVLKAVEGQDYEDVTNVFKVVHGKMENAHHAKLADEAEAKKSLAAAGHLTGAGAITA